MSKTIVCKKYNKPLAALTKPPLPGKLGQRLQAEISQQAWTDWKARQTMFINEYRLNLTDAKARQFLQDQMMLFLFEDQDNKPEGFTE